MALQRPSKRVVLPVIAVALVLFSGLYTWQSLVAWKGYEARLNRERTEYAELKNDAFNGKTTNARLSAVRKLDDKVKKRGDLCTQNVLYAWQASVVPLLKDGVERCKTAAGQLDLIAGPLSGLRQYLDTAVQIQGAVSTLVPSGSLNETNWDELGLKRAQQIQKKIDGIPATGDAAELKEQAKKLSDNLVKSWQSLIQANDKKDAVGFLTASAGVAKAYADFAGLADTSDSAISEKADALTEAASKLRL